MPTLAEKYELHKSRARERSRELSAAAREIASDSPGPGQHWRQTGDAGAFAREFGIASPSVAGAIHAALSGQHGTVALMARTKALAIAVLADIRRQLECNDLLLAAFPQVCYPIRRLEGIPQRRLLWNGEPTGVELRPDMIRLPVNPVNPANGCRIVAVKKNQWMDTRAQWLPAFFDDQRPHCEIVVDTAADEITV